ncbi:hypothetical protein Cni_G15928 [Canna indica]|uniref:Pentatricopeptide repeat-containing protein n=1 Tax=Canna indica TaxID=4628 RepID=A0AAQ3KGZ3_9LILI|nr:hypothetical protein Cni_G15928 [Canna indica]
MRLAVPLQQFANAVSDEVRRGLAGAASHGRAVPPDLRAYGFLIQRCAEEGRLREGQHLHARLVALGVVPSNFLASKLISLYSRCGRLPDARRMFDQIPCRNLFAWNSMLLAYALHGHGSHALRLFSSIPTSLPPDAFTISALLKSLSSLPASSAHRAAHALALRHGLVHDIFVSNGLITSYAYADDLGCARRLFDAMPHRDIVSWNSMISGYSQSGHYQECLQLYREMAAGSDGVLPDAVTVLSVLQACSQMKDLVSGLEVHRFVVEHGIELDRTGWNSVIGFYAKCGSLDYARQLFDEMSDKDGVSYSAMITGYMSYGLVGPAIDLFRQALDPVLSTWNAVIAGLAQNNRHDQVLEFVRRMQASGFRPNAVTLSSLLPTLSFYSNLLGGKQVHGYAIRNDCDQSIYLATALVDTYAKAGFLQGARRVFQVTTGRSVVVWTAIISAYAAHGDAETTLNLFDRMLGAGIKPDDVTLTAVLSACAHAGAVEEARRIFDAMTSIHGVLPTSEHYTCMVGVLSRRGMLKEAVEFIKTMPLEPNSKTWGSVLNGAAVYGDVEIGQFAFEQLLEIEPESTGNYVLMANLFSKAGRWEKAKLVRGMMRGIGLAKPPGCSWIESGDGLHSFVARDKSNRRGKEIYAVLQGLLKLMRDEGYASGEELDEETEAHRQNGDEQ